MRTFGRSRRSSNIYPIKLEDFAAAYPHQLRLAKYSTSLFWGGVAALSASLANYACRPVTAALLAPWLSWLGIAALLALVGSRHRIVGPRYEVEAIAVANERRDIRPEQTQLMT